jgi:hypothetical protein
LFGIGIKYKKIKGVFIMYIPPNKKYDFITEEKICQEYINGKTSRELAIAYGYKSKKSILDMLRRHKIMPRNRQNEQRKNTGYANFSLERIDSFEKAYFIGLIVTDGYVIQGTDRKHSSLVGISLTDKDAIDSICELTGANFYQVNKRDKMTKFAYRVNLNGQRFVNQVARLGIYPRKTYNLGKINFNDDELAYIGYFIRGVIDGDGWIRKDGKEFFISSASKTFIEFLTNLMNNVGFDVSYKFVENEYKGYYLIRSAKKENIDLLKKLVYDKPYAMKSKYNRLYNL